MNEYGCRCIDVFGDGLCVIFLWWAPGVCAVGATVTSQTTCEVEACFCWFEGTGARRPWRKEPDNANVE
jgi:hypothetical protein